MRLRGLLLLSALSIVPACGGGGGGGSGGGGGASGVPAGLPAHFAFGLGNENPDSKLQNSATMNAYFADWKLLMQKAGQFGKPVIVHHEPDFWGFIQNAHGNNPASTPVQVASSGFAEVAGLPDHAAGFARALVRLRDLHAPNAIIAWHASHWAGGADLILNQADPVVHANTIAGFFNALGAAFDLVFHDPSDRDAGFKEAIYGDGGASWWDASDFARYRTYLATLHASIGRRGILWQVPIGNTLYRSCDNTWGHYQDNRAQFFLQGMSNASDFAAAGVIAVLFGSTDAGTTHYDDARGDGVTNPAPINGNTLTATLPDDDGGFLRTAAGAYYASGAVPLP